MIWARALAGAWSPGCKTPLRALFLAVSSNTAPGGVVPGGSIVLVTLRTQGPYGLWAGGCRGAMLPFIRDYLFQSDSLLHQEFLNSLEAFIAECIASRESEWFPCRSHDLRSLQAAVSEVPAKHLELEMMPCRYQQRTLRRQMSTEWTPCHLRRGMLHEQQEVNCNSSKMNFRSAAPSSTSLCNFGNCSSLWTRSNLRINSCYCSTPSFHRNTLTHNHPLRVTQLMRLQTTTCRSIFHRNSQVNKHIPLIHR